MFTSFYDIFQFYDICSYNLPNVYYMSFSFIYTIHVMYYQSWTPTWEERSITQRSLETSILFSCFFVNKFDLVICAMHHNVSKAGMKQAIATISWTFLLPWKQACL